MRLRKTLCAVMLTAALGVSGVPVQAASAQVSPSSDSSEYVDIVVQLESRDTDISGYFSKLVSSDEARHQNVQEKIENLVEENPGQERANDEKVEVKADYYNSLDGFVIHAPSSALQEIRQLDGVKGAYIARTFEIPQDEGSSSSELGNKNALDMTGASQVEQTGAGQTICIIDSGLEYTHEAFAGELDGSRLAVTKDQMEQKKQVLVQGGKDASYISDKIPFAFDYADGDANVSPAAGASNHGTHVAGIAAANAGKVRGTAPDSQIYAMKVVHDKSNEVSETAILSAFDDAAVLEPDVVTMSIGENCGFSDDASSLYSDIISSLEEKGCFVSISAGNVSYATYGSKGHKPFASSPDYGTVSSPSTSASALSVASVNVAASAESAQTSSFSSWGATPELKLKPEIAAPGGSVYSTVHNGNYGYKSGTSMAAPHIAGISALVKERIAADNRFDTLSDREKSDAVTQLLMSTAAPVTDSSSGVYSSPRKQGSGLANAKAAVSSEVLLQVTDSENASHPKAELGSSADGAWTFEIQLRNIGSQPHSFTVDVSALSEQIEDGYFNQKMSDYAGNGIEVSLDGQGYDKTSKTLEVPAASTVSLQVSIACQDVFKAAVSEAVNGTYVEGFVRLLATDDAVDLCVPYLGYYGDWGVASVFDATAESSSSAQTSLCKLVDVREGEDASASHVTFVSDDASKDAASALIPHTFLLRNAAELKYSYKNSSGNTVRSYVYAYVPKTRLDSSGQWEWVEQYLPSEPVFDGYDDNGHKLVSGNYSLEIVTTTSGPDSRDQTISHTFQYETTNTPEDDGSDDNENNSSGDSDNPVVPNPANNQKQADSADGSESTATPSTPATNTSVLSVNVKTVTKKAIVAAAKKAGVAAGSIKEITLGNKTKTIKKDAFKGLSKLKVVTLGKNVKTIKRGAFKGSKVTKLIVKTKKLRAKSIKGSLKGTKVKTVQIMVGSKKTNKKYVKKYRKIFVKKNVGRNPKVSK